MVACLVSRWGGWCLLRYELVSVISYREWVMAIGKNIALFRSLYTVVFEVDNLNSGEL